MIYGLGWTNWLRLLVWLAIGMVIYVGYGRQQSPGDARFKGQACFLKNVPVPLSKSRAESFA